MDILVFILQAKNSVATHDIRIWLGRFKGSSQHARENGMHFNFRSFKSVRK